MTLPKATKHPLTKKRHIDLTGPCVFVLHDDGTKNLFPATKYGKIIVFTVKDVPMYSHDWVVELDDWLSFYRPADDYLLLVGDPVLIGTGCAILGSYHDQLTMLKWDRQNKQYVPITVDIGEEVMNR